MFGYIHKDNALKYTYEGMKTITSLKEQKLSSNIKVDRNNIKICVIDDEGFDTEKLHSLGYRQIDRRLQFDNIDDYEKYDMILCDIEGIGNNLDSTQQGIAVAEQIKTVYPQKIVLIYSGKNVQSYGEIPENIDGILHKQGSSTDLAKQLDRYYKNSIDPVLVWQRIRMDMLNAGISTKTIAVVEHLYCLSALEKKDYLKLPEYDFMENMDVIERYIKILSTVISAFARMVQ